MKTTTCLAVIALAAVLAGVAQAGPKAVERPLPQLFFSENTVLVVHLNLEQITSGRIVEAIDAIIPDKYRQDVDMEKLPEQLAAVDQFVAPLKQLGVARVSAVFDAIEEGEDKQISGYFLVPVSASLSSEQKEQLNVTLAGIGESFQMKAEPYSNWVVLHKEESLPEEGMDLSMRDASFSDALKINPDHDIAVVLVPTESMVTEIKQGLQEAREDADESAKDEVANLGVLVESEWYYLSLVLGKSPELYISTRAKSPAKATEFASAWDNALQAFKEVARKEFAKQLAEAKQKKAEHGIEYDPEDFNPRPIEAMIDALNAASQDTRLIIHLNRGKLETFVNGVIVTVERLINALFEAFFL
jgi:hypothetical protein